MSVTSDDSQPHRKQKKQRCCSSPHSLVTCFWCQYAAIERQQPRLDCTATCCTRHSQTAQPPAARVTARLHSHLQHASQPDCTATCSTRHSQTAQPPAARVTARLHSHLQHASQPDCTATCSTRHSQTAQPPAARVTARLHSHLQHASQPDCTATCSTRHNQTAQPPAARVTARLHSHLQHASQPDSQRSAHGRRQDASHVSRTTEDDQLTSAGPCRPATVSTHYRPRFPAPRFPAYRAWRSEKIFRMYLWWSYVPCIYTHAR